MKIPTQKACFQLFRETGMRENIIDHSILVAKVGALLTDRLIEGGVSINRRLVVAGALLHDITKTRSLETGENHAQSGNEFLAVRGYPAVGEIIRQHVGLDSYFPADVPGEAEIVNYADKRVLHDRVVTLEVRMAYLLERYGTTPENRRRISALGERFWQMEARIFRFIPFSPASLADRISDDILEIQGRK
jgi:putative nucleotidyltransferase with HDIG domain